MKHKPDWSPGLASASSQSIDGWFRARCLWFASARTASSLRERGTDATAATFRICRRRGGRDQSFDPALALQEMRSAADRRSATACRTRPAPVPDAAGPRARRTRGVSGLAGSLGHAVGGRPAHRLTVRLGLTTSHDTILRALKRASRPASTPLRVVGNDDWSWRRRSTYGTLIMDLERRQVADLLPDRRADTTARWLQAHPEIKVISRDCCGLYAVGAAQGAPQARQVADRFHLIQNLREVIERQLSRGTVRIVTRAIPDAMSPGTRSFDDHRTSRLSIAALHRKADRDARRAVRVTRFSRVKELSDAGRSLNDIVRETGFTWRSVSKWSGMEVLAPRQRRSPTHPVLAAYEDHLLARWAAGVRRGMTLFGEKGNGIQRLPRQF